MFSGDYDLDFKNPTNNGVRVVTGAALTEMYVDLVKKYPIILLEDPFDEDDWTNFAAITERLGMTDVVVLR